MRFFQRKPHIDKVSADLHAECAVEASEGIDAITFVIDAIKEKLNWQKVAKRGKK